MADGNLGGATFVVTADTADFSKRFQEMRQEIDRLIQEEKKLEASSRSVTAATHQVDTATRKMSSSVRTGGYALMQIGQAIDDIQYGFHAVVNNISPIVYGLTGSQGLAGAAQVAAVVAIQLYDHWEEVKASFGNTAPFEVTAGAIELIRQKLEEFGMSAERQRHVLAGLFGPAGMALDYAMDHFKPDPELQRRNEAAEKGKEDEEKVRSKEQKQFAKDFQAAAEQYPGGVAQMKQDFVNEQIKGMQGKASKEAAEARRKQLEREFDIRFHKAMAGEGKAGDFGSKAKDAIEGQERQRDFEKQLEARKKAEAAIKRADADHARQLEKQIQAERQVAQGKRQVKQQALQDEADALRKEMARTRRGMNSAQIEQAEDAFYGVKKPRESAVLSTKEYVNRTMTAGLNAGDQKKVDLLTKQLSRLESIDKQMKDLQRLR